MADAIPNIPPGVLAAALKDIEGEAFDLSTVDGTKKAAEQVARLMQHEETLQPLLVALENHAGAEFSDAKLPVDYGPVAMEVDAIPSDPAWNVPPIGSPEFDLFMDDQAQHKAGQQFVVELGQQAPPSFLGFAEDSAEPVSITAVREFDTIIFNAQRELTLLAKKAHRPGVISRVFSALSSSDSTVELPLRFATTTFKNCTVVEARKGDYTKLNVKALVSGKNFFVTVSVNGKFTMKDKITLTDHVRAVQRLKDVLSEDAAVGAEALHEWRYANAKMFLG